MRRLWMLWGLCLGLFTASVGNANTIAVTEFLNQPIGESTARQWVELFNYGAEPVTLKSWQLLNEAKQIVDVPEMTIPSGGYAILVLGAQRMPGRDKKALFEREWLDGQADARVFGISNAFFVLRNSSEITLRNSKRLVVWQLAYKNDGQPGHATYLAQDQFFPAKYGTQAAPLINRAGNDLAGTNLLGYESNAATKDPLATESNVSGLEAEAGLLYKSKANGGDAEPSLGSPLKGQYTVKKS